MNHPRLAYRTMAPSPALAAYVRFLWELEGELAPGQPYVHQTMADVCPELIFHYNGQFEVIKAEGMREFSFLAGIQAQTKHTSRYSINRSFGIFGVYLYPYTLPVLFQLPATELTDQYIDLLALLGKEGKELEEKMLIAQTTAQRVQIISGYLEQKIQSCQFSPVYSVMSHSIQHILQTKGNVRVSHLAQQACLSERQFERNFRHFTGFGPKLFSRIVRFHSVFGEYNTAPFKTLTNMALACGYYDQSHFIEDFKLFSGKNPRQFFTDQIKDTPWMQG